MLIIWLKIYIAGEYNSVSGSSLTQIDTMFYNRTLILFCTEIKRKIITTHRFTSL